MFGYYLLQNNIFLRCIGRLAFPIFAYQVAVGFHKTKNRYKYIFRMIVFAVVSEVILQFLHSVIGFSSSLNIRIYYVDRHALLINI